MPAMSASVAIRPGCSGFAPQSGLGTVTATGAGAAAGVCPWAGSAGMPSATTMADQRVAARNLSQNDVMTDPVPGKTRIVERAGRPE